MSRPASFHRLAEIELFEAITYYANVGNELAAAFVAEAQAALGSILAFPESAPLVGKTVRRKQLRRFPYALLYAIRPAEIRVLAVANLKRRPFYWRGRK